MGIGRRASAATLCWLAVWGCGDGSDGAAKLDPVVLFCEADCSNAGRCGYLTAGGCAERCRQNNAALAIYSSSYMQETAACLKALSCDAILGDGFYRCFDDAVGRTQPTAATRTFCEGWIGTWFECGGWLGVAECEQDYARFGPDTLDQLAQCQAAESCQELAECVELTWGWL